MSWAPHLAFGINSWLEYIPRSGLRDKIYQLELQSSGSGDDRKRLTR